MAHMTHHFLIKAACLTAVASAGMLALPLRAAGQSISIDPPIQAVTVTPAQESAAAYFTVANPSAKPQKLYLSLSDFTAQDSSQRLILTGIGDRAAGSYGLSSWMHLQASSLELPAGGSATVKVLIDTDASLPPGGHYAALVASTYPTGSAESSPGGDGIRLQAALTGLIFLTKEGGGQYGLRLTDSSFAQTLFSLPESLDARIQNKGTLFAIPRGIAVLTSPDGSVISQGTFNSDSLIVLPGISRTFATALHTSSARRIPGRYRLTVSYRPDGEGAYATQEYSFWYVGAAGAGTILAVGVSLFIIALRRKRHTRVAVPKAASKPSPRPPQRRRVRL